MIFYKTFLTSIYVCVVASTVSKDFVTDIDMEPDYDDDDYDDYTDLNSTASVTAGTLIFIKELINVTRSEGKSVRFHCEVKNLDKNVTDEKVQITWEQNWAEIETNKRKKIYTKRKQDTTESYLKIKQLEATDTGYYACIATYNKTMLKSEGILNVTQKRGEIKSNFEDSFGNSNEGDITTFIPGGLDERSRKDLFSTISNPSLPSLSEQHINNPDLFEKVAGEKQQVSAPVYNASQPFCQRYTENTCRNFLENQFVFIQPPHTQRSIEESLEQAVLVVSQSNEISTVCTKFVLPSLCFSAYPVCSDYQQIHTYQQQYINKKGIGGDKQGKVFKNLRNQLTIYLQRICKEDCVLLETELCSREYAIAKRHPIISKVLDLEECENLPNESEKYSSSCLKLGIDRTQNVNKDDTCFWSKGDQYRGVHDRSISGTKCMRWAHQFHIPLTDHPELIGHSYCRNPGAAEAEPYCFVEQNKKETCGLQNCANVLWLYGIGSGVVLVVIAGIIASFLCYRKKYKTRNIQNLTIPTVDKNIYGNGGPSSPLELNTLLPSNIPPARTHSANKNSFQNIPNYTYKEVTFIDELGEGAFGKVYKGELKTKVGKTFVAVKSLKENASAKTQADFQREIELISELKHPNIICLLGIVIKQEPMCMLFEYMSEGDLHEFLINNSPNCGKSLTQIQFLHISIQIAQGMEYLSDNHYVHRDLAARNCLVSKDLVVKISDFGLSRDMYSCDYYRVQSKSLLPVRWMPPESILYGKFTTESDVWSYGVVLWEIYSYGLQPYYGYNNQEVINMIRSRKLLPCPESCPSYCYALMVECWAELAMRRPSFGEISHRLKVWKQNGSSAGAYFKSPEVVTNPQKFGHSSKSSHSSEAAPTICPTFENQNDPSLTWERNLKKTSANKLNESQSSLTSRSSSLGNKTQSTNLSDQNTRNSRKSIDRKSQKSSKADGSLDRRNIVVSTNGENVETKLT